MESCRKMFLNYFQFHWGFIDYNANACIYCFEIFILTYSDFAFDNVNFNIAVVSVKGNICRLYFCGMTKDKAVSLMKKADSN